ncbi:Hypothetical predicted protein [Paramuricea clavata]|uniref:Uncharacterized protein n=1 Tax=Paramuricea clavata TaxID=317549 RepID=A0A6S7GL51_PARCT|nr:Hypothetical predicted protein [Paramuricea clavata]
MAFDVAVSNSGLIRVSDVQANKIVLMKRTDNDIFKIDTSVGSGEAASKAQLLEPTGLCFDFDTLLFCCFGGKNNGKNRAQSCCKTWGYNRIEYAEGLQRLSLSYLDSLPYLENFMKQRKAFLNTAPAGLEEQHYPSFAELMKSLEVQRANSGVIQDNTRPDEYVFVPGDIVVVNPGIDNDVPSEEYLVAEVPVEIQAAEHEQELQVLHKRRQQIIRNVDGQILTSHKDLYRSHPVQRRTTKQKPKELDVNEAERDNPEFQ